MIILLDENFPLRFYTRLQRDQRVEIWHGAVKQFLSKKWDEKFFELYDDGILHPVNIVKK